MRYNKKIICLVLTLSMIVGFGMPVEFNSMSKAEAKKVSKPVLNKKKVTISLKTDAANTTTLKVKKASKKVTWKTSNKKNCCSKKGHRKEETKCHNQSEGRRKMYDYCHGWKEEIELYRDCKACDRNFFGGECMDSHNQQKHRDYGCS